MVVLGIGGVTIIEGVASGFCCAKDAFDDLPLLPVQKMTLATASRMTTAIAARLPQPSNTQRASHAGAVVNLSHTPVMPQECPGQRLGTGGS